MRSKLLNYTLNTTTKEITITDIVGNGDLSRLVSIYNKTRKAWIYQETDIIAFGGSFTGNVFTYNISPSGWNNTDELIIIYFLNESIDTQKVKLEGKTTDFYPQSVPLDPINQSPSFDVKGSLITRGSVTTDEGTFRANFANSSLLVSIGTCSFTNGSFFVTGTDFTQYDLFVGQYVKLDSDSNTHFAQIDSFLDINTIILKKPYTGTTSTGATSRSIMKYSIGTGGAMTVSNGLLTIDGGTTSGSVNVIGRSVDVAPLVFRSNIRVTQRIANQTINIGLLEDASVIRWFARFQLDGATNTTVKCQTARNPTIAPTGLEIQETVITLPNGLTTATTVGLEYRIELLTESVNFFINDVLVARHTRSIPSQYDVMSSGIAIINTGTPASNTQVLVDYVTCKNHNKVEVGVMSTNESIISQQPPLQPFNFSQAGAIGANIDLIIIDCLQLKSLSIQCSSMGTGGVITPQWTNDPTFANRVTATINDGAGANSTTFNAAVLRVTNVMARYFILRLTTAVTTGTTTLFVNGSQLSVPTFLATQPISGTVTANIGTGSIAAGTNAIGDVGLQYRATTTGAIDINTNIENPATPTVQVVKAATGKLYGFTAINTGTTTKFVKFFISASPVLGTTSASFEIALPQNQYLHFNYEGGISFGNGIRIAITGNKGLTDNTAITANEVTGFITAR